MDNKEIVLAYVDAMNRGDMERQRQLFSAEAEIVGVTGRGSFDYASGVWRQLHAALNMRLEVRSIVAEGDVVAVRFEETGVWTQPFRDFDAPTGRSFRLDAIEWFEIAEGKILRRWGVRDGGSLAAQVGFPARQPA